MAANISAPTVQLWCPIGRLFRLPMQSRPIHQKLSAAVHRHASPSIVGSVRLQPSFVVHTRLQLFVRLRSLSPNRLLCEHSSSPILAHGEPMTVKEWKCIPCPTQKELSASKPCFPALASPDRPCIARSPRAPSRVRSGSASMALAGASPPSTNGSPIRLVFATSTLINLDRATLTASSNRFEVRT